MYSLRYENKLSDQVRALPAKEMRSEAVSFLRKRADNHIKSIQLKFYSGRKKNNQGVEVRSGDARAGWKAKVNASGRGQGNVTIENKVPHHDFMKEKTITPKNGKFLAIPIGPALTNKGEAKYKSPWDVDDLHTRKLSDGRLVMYKGKKDIGRNRYFVLVKKVVVPAYTEDLPEHMEGRFMEDFSKLETRLVKKFGGL